MSHRTLAAVVVVAVFFALAAMPALAQDRAPVSVMAQAIESATLPADGPVSAAEPQAPLAAAAQSPTPIRDATRPNTGSQGKGTLNALYATTIGLQVLDIQSSLSGISSGAVEANGLMKGVTKSPAAFIAVKVGVAAGTILAARKISKTNKAAAIAMLVAVNSAYAMVVAHNYKVAGAAR